VLTRVIIEVVAGMVNAALIGSLAGVILVGLAIILALQMPAKPSGVVLSGVCLEISLPKNLLPHPLWLSKENPQSLGV
jgi:hypothetical protein